MLIKSVVLLAGQVVMAFLTYYIWHVEYGASGDGVVTSKPPVKLLNCRIGVLPSNKNDQKMRKLYDCPEKSISNGSVAAQRIRGIIVAATKMALEIVMLSEVSQTEYYHLTSLSGIYKEMIQMNLLETETGSPMAFRWKKVGKGYSEFGMDMYTRLYLKRINNKDQLCNT